MHFLWLPACADNQSQKRAHGHASLQHPDRCCKFIWRRSSLQQSARTTQQLKLRTHLAAALRTDHDASVCLYAGSSASQRKFARRLHRVLEPFPCCWGDTYCTSPQFPSAHAGCSGVRTLQQRKYPSQALYEHHAISELSMQDAREPMVRWLAAAVESSAGRAKMGRNIRQLPSDAFCLTLNAVLLKLCDPFVDPSANKAWSKLDIRCTSLTLFLDTHGVLPLPSDVRENTNVSGLQTAGTQGCL